MLNINTLLKLDRETGDIIWKLGGYGDEFGLTEEQKFSRQHNATITEDGTLPLFDNGWDRGLSRVIELTLDEENKQVLNYDEFSLQHRYSPYMGSAQKLATNAYLIGWRSADTDTAIFSEVNASTGEILAELHFVNNNMSSYRVFKFE